jgi:hypothetical protein
MTDQVWVSNYLNKTYMCIFSYKFRGPTKGITWKIFEYYVWTYWHVVQYFNMLGIIMLTLKESIQKYSYFVNGIYFEIFFQAHVHAHMLT